MLELFENKYRIDSIRLKWYDYRSNWMYFITICTKNREHFFGENINWIMFLSKMWLIVQKYWLEISNHFPFVLLNEFVVMPNHIHGIIIIDNSVEMDVAIPCRDVALQRLYRVWI